MGFTKQISNTTIQVFINNILVLTIIYWILWILLIETNSHVDDVIDSVTLNKYKKPIIRINPEDTQYYLNRSQLFNKSLTYIEDLEDQSSILGTESIWILFILIYFINLIYCFLLSRRFKKYPRNTKSK